jgi:organic hydroperoxide reductase OsmC/OhrA
MSEDSTFELTMDLESDFKFKVDLNVESAPVLSLDEPPPIGNGEGPNAARLLAAAVGNCMSASALFCLRKAHIEVAGMHTTVRATMGRNERGRQRVAAIEVRIEPEVAPEDVQRMKRCLDIFEDYCVVAQSIRDGIEVTAEVQPKSVTTASVLTAAPSCAL